MTFGPSAHGGTPPPLRHADVLNGWSLVENPIHLRRHKLQKYTQHEGQKFSVWWAAKLNLVKMCNLEKGLSREDMLVLELIGGVFDENLRTELIRRSGEADYEGLLKIAQNWHTSAITINGLASEGTDETARKAISTYNQRKAEDWNERNKVQPPPKPTKERGTRGK